jgi:subtilisin family serine protease
MQAFLSSSIARVVLGLALVAATVGAVNASPHQVGPPRTYVLVYGGQTEAQSAQRSIEVAGGAVVAVYGQLGLAFARSGDATFSSRVRQLPGVIGVAPTDKHVWRLPAESGGLQTSRGPERDTSAAVENVVGPLTGRQWDMKMIHAVEAHAANPGSRKVVVGVIDTGIDYRHPNLVPNLDFGKSVSCIGGTPNTRPSAWDDDTEGHGTHVAGTIAASSEKAGGMGIDGVAPNVRIAAIKTGDSDGNFLLEAVVCAFTWAGDHHINVTNNSYFSDPWLYHCLNDPEQKAIWVAEKRALNYAASKGVINVAAAGNFNDDLANPTFDAFSPDWSPKTMVFREVDNNCYTFPSMVPGVITVSSVGQTKRKAYYSSYGEGIVKVTAPGGDFRVTSAEFPDGTTLSTVPHWFPADIRDCTTGGTCGNYAWFQGTSMASPHVAGVVALILSRDDGDNRMSQAQVLSRLTSTADPLACPPEGWYSQFFSPRFPSRAAAIPPSVERHPAQCEGEPGHNNYYGAGLVNALRAVGGDKD